MQGLDDVPLEVQLFKIRILIRSEACWNSPAGPLMIEPDRQCLWRWKPGQRCSP